MNKSVLNIGRFEDPMAKNRFEGFKAKYQSIEPTVQLIECTIKPDIDSAILKIISGDLDVLLLPLKYAPLKLQEQVTIATLSVRERPNYQLVFNKKHTNISIIKNRETLQIACVNEALMLQVQQLFPQHNYSLQKNEQQAHDLEKHDAIIVAMDEEWITNNKDNKVFTFETSELVPIAGTGVYAGLCLKNNRELRKKLMLIHQRETAHCTNIERKISIENFEKLSVFCSQNVQGNYEVKACFLDKEKGFISHRLSQNTYIGLADKMISLLRS